MPGPAYNIECNLWVEIGNLPSYNMHYSTPCFSNSYLSSLILTHGNLSIESLVHFHMVVAGSKDEMYTSPTLVSYDLRKGKSL